MSWLRRDPNSLCSNVSLQLVLRTTQTEGNQESLSLLGPWIGGMSWPLSAPGSEKQTQEANMFLQMSGSKY